MRSFRFFVSFALGSVFLISLTASASQQVHGVLTVVKGDVKVTSSKTGKPQKARVGTKVFPKDIIVAAKDSRGKIVMVDKNEINIMPETQIEIADYEFDPAKGKKNVIINVLYGKMRASVNQKYDDENKFQVKTPSAVAGVRGTDFITGFNRSDRTSQVITFQGQVAVGTPGPGGSILNPVLVNPGQMTSARPGSGPSIPAPIPASELSSLRVESEASTATGIPDAAPGPAGGNEGQKEPEKGEAEPAAPKDDKKASRGVANQPNSVGGGDVLMAGAGDLGPAPESQPQLANQGIFLPPNLPGPGSLVPSVDSACGQFCLNQISNGRSRLLINVSFPQQ